MAKGLRFWLSTFWSVLAAVNCFIIYSAFRSCGLCAQIIYFTFEIIGGFRSHLLLLFFFERKKICQRKKQEVQDLIPPPSIYIHMRTLYTFTNIYIFVHLDSSDRVLQVSHSYSWAHNRIPHLCSVCVCLCVYTHIHPHTLPPAL